MKQAQKQARSEQSDQVPEHSTGSPIVDQFSLIQGGPIYRFQVFIKMAMPDRAGVLQRALLGILLTWCPLLILSLIHGQAFGNREKIPFIYDFAVNIRFLITLPLLIAAEIVIDPRLRHAARHFVNSGLVPVRELHAYEETVLKITRLRDAAPITVLLIMAAFIPSLSVRATELIGQGMSSWHTIQSPSGQVLSFAGWWFALVSVPLYRLLLFRWIWVMIVWAIFLRKVSKLKLYCVPTHPDKAAGFGFLSHTQLYFGLITFAASATIAGVFANALAYEGATISGLKFLIITFCVLAVLLVVSPLLVLTPKLVRIKERGLFEYGGLGTAYTQGFDTKWVRGGMPRDEALLGTSDIQSLADLSNSFAVVRDMKVVLIDKEILLGLVVPTVFPMLVLLLVATPADELIKVVFKLLG